MGVDVKCKLYTNNRSRWDMVRAAVAGEDAIRAGGEIYLPRPSGMTDPEWKAYYTRAHWFGATGRTAEGLHGMVFQKAPVLIDCPNALLKILEDIDTQGTNLDQFASDVVWDTLPTNWGGILVDYPRADDVTDRATVEKKGYRAYAVHYSAEAIINWRYKTIDNKRQLSMVVLVEPYEAPLEGDVFSTQEKKRYRVLSLDEAGNYQQHIYDEGKPGGLETPSGPFYPKRNNQHMKYIPFFPFPSSAPEKSMIYDLACENIGHFQKTADHENGLHLTGIPTPFASCPAPLDKDGKTVEVKLGGSSFLWLGDPQATAGYLEFTGKGLEALERAKQGCEERMAILGARIISAEKKGVESAEAARIHRAGENSVLASFALNASDVFTAVIREIGLWENIPGSDKTTYKLNTDYDMSQMNPQLFTAWTTARIQNEIPRVVYFNKLKANGDIPPEMEYEDYLEALDADNMNHGHGDKKRNSGETKTDELTA